MKHSLQETDLLGFAFCFVLLNICYLVSSKHKFNKQPSSLPWLLAFIFCIFGVWSADYFTFNDDFHQGFPDFRDVLYPYLTYISFDLYPLFRFYIWGLSLLFFSLSCKRLKFNRNLSICVLIFFYLMSFSYPRAILGMASYFYGLTILKNPSKDRIRDICNVALLFFFSFLAHRSMVILIALTPLTYIKLSKKLLFAILVISPLIASLALGLIGNIAEGADYFNNVAALENFNTTAEIISSLGDEDAWNWKFMLSRVLDYSGYYVVLIFVSYVFLFSTHSGKIPAFFNQMLVILWLLAILAIVFMIQKLGGLMILGYRLLYMNGIPLCLCMIYILQKRMCKWKTALFVFLPAILYSESYLFGKILTAMNLW